MAGTGATAVDEGDAPDLLDGHGHGPPDTGASRALRLGMSGGSCILGGMTSCPVCHWRVTDLTVTFETEEIQDGLGTVIRSVTTAAVHYAVPCGHAVTPTLHIGPDGSREIRLARHSSSTLLLDGDAPSLSLDQVMLAPVGDAEGWTDVGYTDEDGLTLTEATETSAWRSWQDGAGGSLQFGPLAELYCEECQVWWTGGRHCWLCGEEGVRRGVLIGDQWAPGD